MVTNPGLDLTVTEAADVALIVEITSPGNIAADRAIKPPLYAQAGVPHYLRIEMHGGQPTALVLALRDGRYVEVDRVPPGGLTRLTEPIAVTLDLAALAEPTGGLRKRPSTGLAVLRRPAAGRAGPGLPRAAGARPGAAAKAGAACRHLVVPATSRRRGPVCRRRPPTAPSCSRT